MSKHTTSHRYSRRSQAVLAAVLTLIGSLQLASAVGSEPEPSLIKAVNVTNGSLTSVGSTLFFSANDGVNGTELWKSDGTEAGTVLVKDIVSGSGSSSPSNLRAVGSTLFFSANDGVNGTELWKSDGTEVGTVLVKDIVTGSGSSSPSNLTAVGTTLFFSANDGVNGTELWKSDGTGSGTELVKDIIPGAESSLPENLTAVQETLFFTATSSVGRELWKSDGSTGGTELVLDIRPGSLSSSPAKLTAVGSKLFFSADNGTDGTELWKSDSSSTALIKDIRAGSLGSSPDNLTAAGNVLYFSANNSVSNNELWKSDGTDNGTLLVKDIHPSSSSNPQHITLAGLNIFFAASDGTNGNELWKTDGSADGTMIVKDIVSGSGSSFAFELTAVGNSVYFRSSSQIWKSNGTDAGTTMVSPVNFSNLKLAGSNMFFRAPSTNQLWGLNVASDLPATTPPEQAPSTGSFISLAPAPLSTSTPKTVRFGDSVTIFGSNLDFVTDVLLGGITAPILAKTSIRLDVRTPRGLSGLVNVELRSPMGNAVLVDHLNFGTRASVSGPVRERLVVGGFAPNAKKLTKKMKSRIDSWLDRNYDLTTLTCTGFTSLPRTASDVVLSTSRGARACSYAIKQRPDLNTSITRGIEDPRVGSNVRRIRLVLSQ